MSPDETIELRDSSPRVKVSFAPTALLMEGLPEILDLSRPDDTIIAEAIKYREKYTDVDVTLLTHDTNPAHTAKHCGLSFKLIPDEWLLAPEPDARDKELKTLKERMKLYEARIPSIDLAVYRSNGPQIQELQIEVSRYSVLSESQVDELLMRVQEMYPMVVNYDNQAMKNQENSHPGSVIPGIDSLLGIVYQYISPSDKEIMEYKDVKYPEWITRIKQFLKSLPSILEAPSREIGISVSLSNNGGAPAENLMVQFNLVGGLKIQPPSEAGKDIGARAIPTIPLPPPAPKGRWRKSHNVTNLTFEIAEKARELANVGSIIPSILSLPNIAPLRDKHAFYWKPSRPITMEDQWSLECEEFQHRVKSKCFDMTIVIPDEEEFESGALRCLITAKNLPMPFERIIPIKVLYKECDTLANARDCIQRRV